MRKFDGNWFPTAAKRVRRAVLSLTCLCIAMPTISLPAQSSASATRVQNVSPPLRPGDGLRVRIFREPELSGEYAVDERGIVVLPKIGEWAAGGVSADSVRRYLITAYRKFLTADAIEITPFRRVAVTGAVLKPGLYPIDPSMSVADAIILAGGVSQMGKRDVVELRVAGSALGIPIGSELLVWSTEAGGPQQLYVPMQPWLRRNLATALTISVSLITAVAVLLNARR